MCVRVQIPNYAEALVDMRPMPDTDIDKLVATVEGIISDAITVSLALTLS
jgi:hypothetical protein